MASIEMGLLSGVRVADLTGVFGAYATRLLADHGAEVVRVLGSPSDPAEAMGPFDPEDNRSYFARFVNANKRSVIVSRESLESEKMIADILDWADVVVEELPVLTKWKDRDLVAVFNKNKKNTVVVSIRPFAEGSNSENFVLDDLAAQAVGGLMSLTGNPEREPLALNGGQSHYIIGVFAATAALLGLNDSRGSSHRRHYVVTLQEAMVHSLETAIQYYCTEGVVRGRKGAAQQAGDGSYRVKDGRVVLGAMTDLEWGRLNAWLSRQGLKDASEFAKWELQDRRNPANVDRFASAFEEWAKDQSFEKLTIAGQSNRVLISPSYTLTQILQDGQLTYDQFFRSVSDSQGERWIFPGAPYRISSGSVQVRESARRAGEDTDWFLHEALKNTASHARAI